MSRKSVLKAAWSLRVRLTLWAACRIPSFSSTHSSVQWLPLLLQRRFCCVWMQRLHFQRSIGGKPIKMLVLFNFGWNVFRMWFCNSNAKVLAREACNTAASRAYSSLTLVIIIGSSKVAIATVSFLLRGFQINEKEANANRFG